MKLTSLKVITVEPVLFLYMVSTFMQMGVIQDLIYTKVCLAKFHNAAFCANPTNATIIYNQHEGSYWIRYTNVALTVPSILSTLILGSWCSYYGAKIPLLLPVFGAVLSNLINILLSVYIQSNVAYLLLSQFLSGLFGGPTSIGMAVTSYISQLTLAESRTLRVAVLESMMFLGGTVGPFISGGMLSKTSHASVFLLMVALNFVSFLYIMIRIKNIQPVRITTEEEDNVQELRCTSCKELFGLHHFSESITACFRSRENNRRSAVLLFVFASSLIMFCSMSELDVTYLYTKNEPLKWPYSTFSYYFGMKHGIGALALLIGVPLMRRFWSFHDTTLGLIGLISKIAGLILLSLSTTTAMMFLVPVVSMLSTYPMPALRSMISKLVETDEYGKVFAFIASLDMVSMLLGSVIFNTVYPNTISFFPGLTFVLCAGLLIIPFPILCWFRRTQRIWEPVNQEPLDEGYRSLA